MSTEFANIPWNLVIPVLEIQVLLQVASLVSLVRSDSVRIGNKVIWTVVIVIFGMIGGILYWTIGRDAQ
ncbi:MAG: PLDc N-terminal domain-containing protein [Desulfitobacteriaceae bacterium]